MKVFLSIGMFLMFSISLYSAQVDAGEIYPDVYPKKIVFGTYSKKSSAKYELNIFRKDKVYKELYELALKNNFMIHYRPLADYTILVIEPIHKRNIFFNALNLIRQKYPRAYHLSAEGLDEPMEKPLPPLARKTSKTMTKKPCPEGEVPAKIEEPIFNVEEVSDAKMAVNCVPSTKKDVKKELKPKPKTEQKTQNVVAGKDVKQETIDKLEDNQTVKEPEDKEAVSKVENEAQQKNDVVQESVAKKTEPVKAEKKEESFFSSILNFFSTSQKKSEVTKPEAEKDTKTVQTVPKDMDVPALDNSMQEEKTELDVDMNNTTTMKDEADKLVDNVKITDEADVLDIDNDANDTKDSMVAKNDLNTTKGTGQEMKGKEPEGAKYIVKTVQDENLTKATKEKKLDENMVKAIKGEPRKEEKSFFTFSNVIMILFLIFSPFLYRKFRKLKSLYDQY